MCNNKYGSFNRCNNKYGSCTRCNNKYGSCTKFDKYGYFTVTINMDLELSVYIKILSKALSAVINTGYANETNYLPDRKINLFCLI